MASSAPIVEIATRAVLAAAARVPARHAVPEAPREPAEAAGGLSQTVADAGVDRIQVECGEDPAEVY